jgi:hypothetical protein
MTALHPAEQAVVPQAASICLSYPDGTVREMLPAGRASGSPRSCGTSRPPRPGGSPSTTSRCSTAAAAAACT